MKRVSVIVPCYNSENVIRRCVNSIIPQLTPDDELLLINDGSTDSTSEICNEYQAKYSNVRLIEKSNEGNAKTRTLGISLAEGKYICYVDHDDWLDSDYIETFYNAIEASGMDIVIGGYKLVDENDNQIFKLSADSAVWYPYTFITPWGRIIRTEFLRDNNIGFFVSGYGEDIFFNMQIYSLTDRIKAVDYSGYNWYSNMSSISHTVYKKFTSEAAIISLLNSVYDYISDDSRSISGIKRRQIKHFLVKQVVYYMLYSGRYFTAAEFERQCFVCFNWFKDKNEKVSFPLFGISDKTTRGEKLKTRLIINAFILMYRLHLIKLFSKLYCKGK